ncbi:MAG: hypothetical protein OEY70_00730 [Acidimicrobiia bacterium]|nr:hypothetical protein [Acidimicrobiia bacterium]
MTLKSRGKGWRWVAGAAALALAVTACGGDETTTATTRTGLGFNAPLDDAVVVVANSPDTLTTRGDQRVMVALLGDGPSQFLGGPDVPATFQFESEDKSIVEEVQGSWLSATGATLGLYVTHYTFDAPGIWAVRLKGGNDQSMATVIVSDDSAVPDVGDPAPPSQTLTAATTDDLATISTDPDPDLAFYQLSVADAVNSGKPTVIVFATPAFCQTALCGPTMDIVKDALDKRTDVQVVHVEPYDIAKAKAGQLVPIDAMTEWNLATEPWVFVVGADGKVAASFEGILGENELVEAVDSVTGNT